MTIKEYNDIKDALREYEEKNTYDNSRQKKDDEEKLNVEKQFTAENANREKEIQERAALVKKINPSKMLMEKCQHDIEKDDPEVQRRILSSISYNGDENPITIARFGWNQHFYSDVKTPDVFAEYKLTEKEIAYDFSFRSVYVPIRKGMFSGRTLIGKGGGLFYPSFRITLVKNCKKWFFF